jgi:ketol-acid reductoisomerase
MRVYYDRDADINLIKDKGVLIVGYGSRAMPMPSICATRRQRRAYRPARRLGHGQEGRRRRLQVMTVAEGAKWADVVMMLTPDELQATSTPTAWLGNMKDGASLIAFAHGLNVHFNLIEPRADLDVFMIAPKGPGHTVRSNTCVAAACRA